MQNMAAEDQQYGLMKIHIALLLPPTRQLTGSTSKKTMQDPIRLKTIYVDLGELKEWGTPKNYDFDHKFSEYTESLWDENSPELVLIDGRFRVCCFLTTLIRAGEGTKVIFDDYVDRPHYHIVERFINPTEYCGRQALFVVPNSKDIDTEGVEEMIQNFRYVMQ